MLEWALKAVDFTGYSDGCLVTAFSIWTKFMTYLVQFSFWDCATSKIHQIWNLNCTNLVKHLHLTDPCVRSPIQTKWKSYLPLLLLPTMSLRFVFSSSSQIFHCWLFCWTVHLNLWNSFTSNKWQHTGFSEVWVN